MVSSKSTSPTPTGPSWGGGYNIPGAAQEVRFNMKLDFIQYFQISRNIFWLPYSFTPYILWKVTQYISSSTVLNQKEKCILIYSTNPIFIWQQWLCRQMFTYKIRNSLNFDPPGPATTLKYCLNVKVFLSIIQYNIHDDVTVWKDDSALEVL